MRTDAKSDNAYVGDSECISATSKGKCYVTATPMLPAGNSLLFKFLVDTGASVTVLSHSMYTTHFSYIKRNSANVVIKGFSGDELVSDGVVTIQVGYMPTST